MNIPIIKLIFVGWVVAFICVVTVPIVTALAPSASASLADGSQVWHHRPANLVGPEVVALNGQPGIGGRLPFLHELACVKKTDEGVWEVRPDRIEAGIMDIAAEIESAGYLMLDIEGPLDSHENVWLYIEVINRVREVLAELNITAKVGVFRIPDHSVTNAANRFAMTPVLRHTDAIFIMVKGPGQKWDDYLADVVQVAPNHAYVWYMDAADRKNGQPFSEARILDTVRLAHRWLRNDQVVFRQSGPDVARAMELVAEWLGYEATGDDPLGGSG